MLRIYLRLGIIPFLIFSAMLLLIHAQPYDDQNLRHILLPDGCPAPCFMGIRPEVTTVDEAVKLLQASGWVEQIEYPKSDRINKIKVRWNANKPIWLVNDGLYGGSSFWIANNLVTDFRLDTSITLGDIQLSLGRSSFQNISRGSLEGHDYLFYSLFYPNLGIVADVSNSCNGQHKNISIQDKVYLGFAQLPKERNLAQVYNGSWADLLRTSCN